MTSRLKFHPSFGYATPEQIERLQAMNLGPDRDALISEIRTQTQKMKKAQKRGARA